MSANSSRQLAPWEEIVYFNAPKWTQIAPSSTAWTLLVTANPQRVCIMLQGSTNNAFITTDQTQPTTVGIAAPIGLRPVIFTEADNATLCTAAWYGIVAAGTVINVAEVILRQMPECQP